MKRLGKEYSININDFFDVKYGSVNKKQPKVVYMLWTAWISPQFQGDYKTPLKEVKTHLQQQIKTAILNSPNLENDYIVESNFKFDQLGRREKNFLTVELFVKQKTIESLEDFKGEIIDTFKPVIDECTSEILIHNFKLTKSKKGE